MDERGCGMGREERRGDDERGYTLLRCRLGSASQGAEEVLAGCCRCNRHCQDKTSHRKYMINEE